MSNTKDTDIKIENHEDDPLCQEQWCCSCAEHPAGKPWGYNSEAWAEHYREFHSASPAGCQALIKEPKG